MTVHNWDGMVFESWVSERTDWNKHGPEETVINADGTVREHADG